MNLEVNNKLENSIWAEKYRPKNVDEYIGPLEFKSQIKNWIIKGSINHLMLHGSSGTGKTSLAKIITKELNCDYIIVNGSDETGVENIRSKIKGFASTTGFKDLKVVVFDECDFLSQESLAILRRILEEYALTTRFIFTCNYIHKILPAILSRCQTFEIKPLSKKEIAQHLVKILNNESVKFDVSDVAFVVNTYYPDIRKMINFCQQSSIDGLLKISKENAIELDFKNKLIELLKTPSRTGLFNEIRQLTVNADVGSFEGIYKYLFEHVEEYGSENESQIILEIAESIYQSSLIFEKEITFLACICKILKVLNNA